MELVLIRGLPGSAKSSIAYSMPSYVHVEADDFWMVDGKYQFDVERIKNAHHDCLIRTDKWLGRGYRVVVANTFTTEEELEPYFVLSQKYKIIPNVVLCQSSFGNIHNVPQDVLDNMKKRFVYDISDLYVKYKLHGDCNGCL